MCPRTNTNYLREAPKFSGNTLWGNYAPHAFRSQNIPHAGNKNRSLKNVVHVIYRTMIKLKLKAL
jgi:hypothetical protein